LAHQSTLFLDEIGDIPLELQHNLIHRMEKLDIPRRPP
jgi:transcriptional regulator with GAF, ATPase, and Fis domain